MQTHFWIVFIFSINLFSLQQKVIIPVNLYIVFILHEQGISINTEVNSEVILGLK